MLASPDRNGFSQTSCRRAGCATVPRHVGRQVADAGAPARSAAVRAAWNGRGRDSSPLGDVVGELVAEREAERGAACRRRRSRRGRRSPAPRRRPSAKAGRRAARPGATSQCRRPCRTIPAARRSAPGGRLAAFEAHAEHLHGVGEVVSPAAPAFLCIASRASAEPRWVRPVPVIMQWAGSSWSSGGSRRFSFNAAA